MSLAPLLRIRSEARSRRHGTITDSLETRIRRLREIRVFADVPDDTLESVASTLKERYAAPNDAIFLQMDEGSALYWILAGEVRIVIGDIDGHEQVLRVLGPGEMFGEIAALDGRPRSANAIAVTRCRLWLLERCSLLALIASQPAVAIGLSEIMCDRMRYVTAQVEGLLFRTLSERLASALLGLCNDKSSASINLTQTELGRLTGVTRESVNKKLRHWQTTGLVELQPGRVRISHCTVARLQKDIRAAPSTRGHPIARISTPHQDPVTQTPSSRTNGATNSPPKQMVS
jgi:CRP/FNR family cyclic AMP-dependent transcriptional regulator